MRVDAFLSGVEALRGGVEVLLGGGEAPLGGVLLPDRSLGVRPDEEEGLTVEVDLLLLSAETGGPGRTLMPSSGSERAGFAGQILIPSSLEARFCKERTLVPSLGGHCCVLGFEFDLLLSPDDERFLRGISGSDSAPR